MPVQLETFALAGGLDEASGKTSPQPGRLLGGENFEILLGYAGYSRIRGYERLDGRSAPSVATYGVLPFQQTASQNLLFSAPLTSNENDVIAPTASATVNDPTAVTYTSGGGVFVVDNTNNNITWTASKLAPASYSSTVVSFQMRIAWSGTPAGDGDSIKFFQVGDNFGGSQRWDALLLRVVEGVPYLYIRYFSYVLGYQVDQQLGELQANDLLRLEYDTDAATVSVYVNNALIAGPYSTDVLPYTNNVYAGSYAVSSAGGIASVTVSELVMFSGSGSNTIPLVGDTVTGPSGSGLITAIRLSSGSWANGDAVGTLSLVDVTGTFSTSDALSVGSQFGVATAPYSVAGPGTDGYADDIKLAREHYRGLIQKPAGEGPIRGVAIFRDAVFCLRDDVGGVTATLWVSSPTGWQVVRSGLRGGGTLDTVVASFTGTAGDQALYGVDGKNRCWRYTGTAFSFAPNIYSSEASSSSSVTPGTGSKTFTVETGRSFPSGTVVRVYSQTNAANYMVGSVTSYSSSTLVINVTSFGGVAANDWHICRDDGTDRPYLVASHKNHLFLGYPKGQLQHSDLGAPFTFGTSAGLIGLGDELRDLQTLRADVLAIVQLDTVSLLYGSGKTSWELKQHSKTSNARLSSMVEIGGNGVFVSDSGILALTGSDAFGDFDASNVGVMVRKTLRSVLDQYTAVANIKSDSQYRVYGGSQVLVMSWASPALTPDVVAFTRLQYNHSVVCTVSDTIEGDEYVVFGTSDGWVMRDRVGTTFDGEVIPAFLRTTYWHSGAPQQKKRYRKVILDCDATEPTDISFKLDFDFYGPDAVSTIEFQTEATGGFYDVDFWDEFFWSSPEAAQLEANVDGIGKFMSLMLWCDQDCEPFRVYGMTLQFSPLEVTR